MPRRYKDSKKSSSLKLENLYRKCRYCNANRQTIRFDKHQKACKVQWEILCERRKIEATRVLVRSKALQQNEPEFIQGQGSSAMLVDSETIDDLPSSATSPPIGTCLDNTMPTEQLGKYQYIYRSCHVLKQSKMHRRRCY